MSMPINEAIDGARELQVSWDGERSQRVREGALRLRDRKVRHKRQIRRGIAATGGVCLLALSFLRAGAFAAPASASASGDHASGLVASRAFDDAGFTRD